ncbi:MAG: ATP-grasp domain-containing protein, partial [Magnetococcales bacterium]|nr:ATP-grasp domain-containing protein [Magnetococcales bacterium]
MRQISQAQARQNGRKILFLGRNEPPLSQAAQEILSGPILASGVALVATHGDPLSHLRERLPAEMQGAHFPTTQPIEACVRLVRRPVDMVAVVVSQLQPEERGALLAKAETRSIEEVSARNRLDESAYMPKVVGKKSIRPVFSSAVNAGIITTICDAQPNDFSQSPYHTLPGHQGIQLLAEAASRRGYRLEREDNKTYIFTNDSGSFVCTQNTPDTSIFSPMLTTDKSMTKILLARFGIPVPGGKVFDESREALKYFLSRKGPQVVKPLDGMGGYGVTAGIKDRVEFLIAWRKARAHGTQIIVEDYFEGDEIRIIVLGGRVVVAFCRVPAHVIGDGVRTISELIAVKNKARARNPFMKKHEIKEENCDLMRAYGRSFEEVPAAREFVRLGSPSNIGMGGEAVSVLEPLHPSFHRLARKVWDAIPGATILGLDVLIKDMSRDAEWPGNACVIEVNSNPTIGMPCFVSYGPPFRSLPDDILDFVEARQYDTISRDWGVPTIAPAAAYHSRCGGDSFARDYSTQMRLLRQAAHARNLPVVFQEGVFTIIGEETRRVGFYMGMSSWTRWVARRASDDKEWTKQLLRKHGIATPNGAKFAADAQKKAWEYAQALQCPVVVKPISGSGGRGISTSITSRAHFLEAWKLATATGVSSILVEEYVAGNDYRILVIGNAIR